MIQDQSLAAADELGERIIRTLSPAIPGIPVVIIHDDHIVRSQDFGPAAPEFFDDAGLKLLRIIQRLAERWRRGAPIVRVLSSKNQDLSPFRMVCPGRAFALGFSFTGTGGVLGLRKQQGRTEQERECENNTNLRREGHGGCLQ